MTLVAEAPAQSPASPATLTVVAVVSLLHEGPAVNSATRRFTGRPVLTGTLERLRRLSIDLPIAIAYWDDQNADVHQAARDIPFVPLSFGPRTFHLGLETVAAAQRWADGWRGGLLATCAFDRGFHAGSVAAALAKTGADAALLIDPASPLLGIDLVSDLLAHASEHPDRALVFQPAAPGLTGLLLRKSVVDELVKLGTHPGRALHYIPDQYAHDPIATPAAAPTPVIAARTLRRFTVDSPAQIALLERAAVSDDATTEFLVARVNADASLQPLPRDLRLEITTRRVSRAIFRPNPATVSRPDLTPDLWLPLLGQLAAPTHGETAPTRLTLAGLGDPLLHPHLPDLLRDAHDRGIPVSAETDLLSVTSETLRALAQSTLDVLLVHIPAASAATYTAVMGDDGFAEVMAQLGTFAQSRGGKGTPILVPCFTKMKQNLSEMEPWYDHFLRTVGSAVIDGATDFAGQIPGHAVASMAPPHRLPCRKLQSRLQVLSDGAVVQCEFDYKPQRPLGRIQEAPLAQLWQTAMSPLREIHATGRYSLNRLCERCTEWHRP